MRWVVMVAVAGAALAGCDKQGATPAGTATPLATPTSATATGGPPAGFTPPTSISRADYGGRVERRFRRLDKDGDGKLESGELPQKRAQRLLRRVDKNGDGTIDASEWSAGMLARFDKMDANGDGTLTSDERGKRGGGGKHGGGRGGGRHRHQQQDQADTIDDSGDDVDNGF